MTLTTQPLFGGPALISGFAHGAFPGATEEDPFFIGKVALTWTYLGYAKAGALVVLALMDNHQPAFDGYASEPEFEKWVRKAPFIVEGKSIDGLDSKGNVYNLIEGRLIRSGGFEWIATAILTADVAPGDTVTFQFEPDIPVLALHGEPGASVEKVFPTHEARGEAEFYAWAAVFYGATYGSVTLFEGVEVPRITLVGEGSLPAATNPGLLTTTASLVIGDWTGSDTPAGGVWSNLLNLTDHGNHMLVDFHRDDGTNVVHPGTGTGTGHLVCAEAVAQELGRLSGAGWSSDTEEFVADNTYGEGAGAAHDQGKRFTVTLSTNGWHADAGHRLGNKVTDDSAFYSYHAWRGPIIGSTNLEATGAGEAWATRIFHKIRELWRVVRPADRMPMPVVGELRIKFQVSAHTLALWKEWDGEGEPPYAGGYALYKKGEVAEGDLYENGVRVVHNGPLICGDGSVPTEFVLTEDKRDGLGEGGQERQGEWTFPLGEEDIELRPLESSAWNTLTYDWDVKAQLWWPPHAEPAPLAVAQPQVVSLSKGVSSEPSEHETPPPGGEETPTEEKEKKEKGEETVTEREEQREREEREAAGETGTTSIDSGVVSGVVTRDRKP